MRRGRRSNDRFGFTAGHPQADTHMFHRRDCHSPAQFIRRIPRRPSSDVGEQNEQHEYAAFAVGNFAAYRDSDFAPGGRWNPVDGRSLWDAFLEWEDSDMQPWVKRMLLNVEGYVGAAYRSKEAFVARRQEIAEAESEAGAACSDREAELLGFLQNSSDDDNGEEPVGAEIEFEEDVTNVNPLTEAELDRLAALVDVDLGVHSGSEISEATYNNAAEGVVQTEVSSEQWRMCAAPSNNVAFNYTGEDFARQLKSWDACAKQYKSTNDMAFSGQEDMQDRPIILRYDDSGRLVCARLEAFSELELHGDIEERTVGSGFLTVAPFVLLNERPTIEQTIELFTLATNQAVAFQLMAERLHGDASGDPLRMVIQGEPGTGKSQVIISVLWYAFQWNLSRKIAIMAYTARAAINISTRSNVGETTSSFLEINSHGGHVPRVSDSARIRLEQNLHDVELVIFDEFSFICQAHLASCSRQCQHANVADDRATTSADFGRLNVVLMGDLFQHDPPGAFPLHRGADIEERDVAERGIAEMLHEINQNAVTTRRDLNNQGRRVWRDFPTVIILDEQHRLTGDADGKALYDISRLFVSETEVPRQEMLAALIRINERALLPRDELLLNPNIRVVTWRNSVRLALNKHLVTRRAVAAKKRLYMWRSVDTMTDGAIIPSTLLAFLEKKAITAGGAFPAKNYFFDGIQYLFKDNDAKRAGRVRNNTCTGRAIILDPREIEDDMTKPIRVLQFPPLAICVEPENFKLGQLCELPVPENCIVVGQKRTSAIRCKLPHEFHVSPGKTIKSFTFTRLGIPLDGGYAVTDYFAEGMSFTPPDVWVAHMNPPPSGLFTRASIYVTMSRFRRLSQFHSLLPLWQEGNDAERDIVVDKFVKAAKLSDSLIADFKRLQRTAELTKEAHARLFTRTRSLVEQRRQRVAVAATSSR